MTPQEETMYFNSFKKFVPLLKGGAILSVGKKANWPDFSFRTKEGRKIAIELTELLHPDNHKMTKIRAQESQERLIESELVSLLEKWEFDPKFNFEITLNHKRLIKNAKESREIALIISEYIVQQLQGVQIKKNFSEFNFESNQLKKNKVDKIYMILHKDFKNINGQVVTSGMLIPPISEKEVQRIIDNKSLKGKENELGNFDESWLLIVITDYAANWRSEIGLIGNFTFKSDYSKVFLYVYMKGQYINLKLI